MMANSTGPLRVAQIVTTMARGGAQATVVASSVTRPGIVEVTVLAGAEHTVEGSYWGGEELEGLTAVAVPRLVRRLAPAQDLAALVWLVRWLRSNRPDVLHTHSSKAGVLGRLAAAMTGIPCVHTVHGWGPLQSRRRVVRLLAWPIEWAMAMTCAALVVVGRGDLDFGRSRHIGRQSAYHLIRSGIELGSVGRRAETRTQVRAELGLSDRFVVGMVARMSQQKDHRSLLMAFAAADIPSATLVLVGDGPLRGDITGLVAELGMEDRVMVLGVRPDAGRLVAGFDVSVLSTNYEGMPRTVVEAAAAGVPVVATDVGSIEELIEHEVSGLLVARGDHDGLAEALQRIQKNRPQATAMAEVAAERSAVFSADRMRAELLTLWFELAGRPRPPAVAGQAKPIGAGMVRR